MARYGFLGLGIMGSRMARNLVQAGFEVQVWNRSRGRCIPLLDLGASEGMSPREVAAACDITFAMLADPGAARAVCFGPEGVLEGIGAGRGYVDMSTVATRPPALSGLQSRSAAVVLLRPRSLVRRSLPRTGRLSSSPVGTGASMTRPLQLRSTYGEKVQFNLFLCGYFDSGYLGYEAAEGIDWVWEHRIDDLARFGL